MKIFKKLKVGQVWVQKEPFREMVFEILDIKGGQVKCSHKYIKSEEHPDLEGFESIRIESKFDFKWDKKLIQDN